RRGGDRRRVRELVVGPRGVLRCRSVLRSEILRRRAGGRRPDLGDEPIAAPRHRLDELWLMALVAERAAQHRYRMNQAVVGDDDVVPDRLDELVLADAPISILDQIDERIERPRWQLHRLAEPI